jgi:hypothetical protein
MQKKKPARREPCGHKRALEELDRIEIRDHEDASVE